MQWLQVSFEYQVLMASKKSGTKGLSEFEVMGTARSANNCVYHLQQMCLYYDEVVLRYNAMCVRLL